MGDELSPRGGSMCRPHPEPEAAEETAPGVGAGAPVAGQLVREAARAVEAPARAVEVTGCAAAATSVAATTTAEPPRKRKRGFSTLR
jgi:hypothetical protein